MIRPESEDHPHVMPDDRRILTGHIVKQRLRAYSGTVHINLHESPMVDPYGVVTIGDWGGWLVQVTAMIFNDRLLLTPSYMPQVHDYGWCYPKGGAAYLAALAWDPMTQAEPVGYKKRASMGVRQAGEQALHNLHL